MKIVFVGILGLLLARSSLAATSGCEPMNLLTARNSPFARIPVMDQDGVGLCHAYTAAQLMNFQLVRAGRDPSVHPLWGGVKLAEANRTATVQVGDVPSTVHHILRRGNCPVARIRAALERLVRLGNAREIDVVGIIDRFAHQVYLRQAQEYRLRQTYDLTDQELQRLLRRAVAEQEDHCESGTLQELIPELQNLAVLRSPQMLSNLLLPECQGNLESLALPRFESHHQVPTEEWSQRISETLQRTGSPVGISYCSRFLLEPDHVGVTDRSDPARPQTNPECGPHASIVVGQRPSGTQCQLLIRNSHGNGFGPETENWRCLCRHRRSGAVVDDCQKSTHDDGQYSVEGCWVDGNRLNRNMLQTNWFEASP